MLLPSSHIENYPVDIPTPDISLAVVDFQVSYIESVAQTFPFHMWHLTFPAFTTQSLLELDFYMNSFLLVENVLH